MKMYSCAHHCRKSSPLLLFAAALLCFLEIGCFREVVVDTRSLESSPDQSIVVLARDGWEYRFAGGRYAVTTDSNLVRVLLGKAKRYRYGGPQFGEFEGAIPLHTIERVTISETTPWLYASFATVGVLIAFMIWLGNTFHGSVG